MIVSVLPHSVRALFLAAALSATVGHAAAADVSVSIDAVNSSFNPGPFSSGGSTTFDMDFHVDASVTPTGSSVVTWSAAMDGMVLRIHDANLGDFTVTGRNGSWQQMELGTSIDFISGAWWGNGLSPLSVTNPAISDTPFILTGVNFELRGPHLFTDASTLPGTLSGADLDYQRLVLNFSNDDPAVANGSMSSIVGAFTTASISPVPEPASAALWMVGVAALLGRKRQQARGRVTTVAGPSD